MTWKHGFGYTTSPYQQHNRRDQNNFLWDNELLRALAQESEMTEVGLKDEIKRLADALGIRLPRWSDLSCFSEKIVETTETRGEKTI